MARRRRRKVGVMATLLRALKARRRRNATARRVATKRAQAAQKVIQRESRTTAGKLRASGQLQWAGDGMPDSTVMEPVRTKDGWEWHPAKVQPRQRAHTLSRETGRPPKIPGMRAVQSGLDWYYVPIIKTQSVQDKYPGDGSWARTEAGAEGWRQGDGSAPIQRPVTQKCGAPTVDRTPCERPGDCPIPKHKTWRARNDR